MIISSVNVLESVSEFKNFGNSKTFLGKYFAS